MSLPKFPSEAQPVLDIIRAEVERPAHQPKGHLSPLRWMRDSLCCLHLAPAGGGCYYCPMGLVSGSFSNMPTEGSEFAHGRCTDGAVISFGTWWDSIKVFDAAAAMNLIWGKVEVSP